MIDLEFIDDFPGDREKEVRKLVEPLLRLVQRDLSKLRFKISNDIPGEASIQVKRRYHVANVWLSHLFFSQEPEYQQEILIHEFIHVLVDMLSKDIEQMIDAYFEEGSPERTLMESRFEESEEKLTDALALAFHGILRELKDAKDDCNCFE